MPAPAKDEDKGAAFVARLAKSLKARRSGTAAAVSARMP
jgi:hypothetical protein